MDLRQAIKSVNLLNIDWDESTSLKDTFLSKEGNNDSFIVSDVDEQILILIEFTEKVDLHNITFTAAPIDDENGDIDTSPPKEICLYKAKNVCVNFDDMSSLSADKVIEGKAKKLSKGQKVSLRKKLAFRQIKYLIIYVRANQNDSEKTHLHKMKINGICNAKLNENSRKHAQQITAIPKNGQSTYIQRIDALFKQQEGNKMSDEHLYDFVCEQYGGDISKFLNDYHKFIKNLNSNHLYLLLRNTTCSKKNCIFMNRMNRYKRNENAHKTSIIRQSLQQIHILCHDKNYRQQLIKMKKTECGDEKEQITKFVTAVTSSGQTEKYLEYSSGFQFYYHPFYADNNTHQLGREYDWEIMPNFRMDFTEDEWKTATFKYWYVPPKYKDLKEEIVGNGHLTLEQFENEMNKAMNNIQTSEGKKLRANDQWATRYAVFVGTPITVNHMLCVLMYTNYNALQHVFSKSFRKESSNEDDNALKNRHSVFVHFAKFITEAVHSFGNDKLTKSVYHGVNALTMFGEFSQQFLGPISTTTDGVVAISFATNNGTVIEINQYPNQETFHFDCELWSDFAWEKEKLFIAMKTPMDIINVYDIHKNIEYEEWTEVIRAFKEILIDGRFLFQPMSDFVEKGLYLLLQSVTNESVKDIPEYIVDTFNHIRMNTKGLRIDMHTLSNEIWLKHADSGLVFYGGKKLKRAYFDNNDNIKWKFINLLFPKLSSIWIFSFVHDSINASKFSCGKVILINADLLNAILAYLENSEIQNIKIYSPSDSTLNDVNTLKGLKVKFRAVYEKIGYWLDITENYKGDNVQSENESTLFTIERQY